MKDYNEYISSLAVNEDFKRQLTEKLCSDNCGRVETEERSRFSGRRKRIKVAAFSAACAVVACAVLIPAVMALIPAGSAAPDGSTPPGDATGDNMQGGDSPAQASVFGLGQRAEDACGNSIEFSSVSYGSSVCADGVSYTPSEGKIFVSLGVTLDLTHADQHGEFVELSLQTVTAGYCLDFGGADESRELIFRQDIFDAGFAKDEHGRACGEGVLVFEADESFVSGLGSALPSSGTAEGSYIVFECDDFGVEGEVQHKIQTQFYLDIDAILSRIR